MAQLTLSNYLGMLQADPHDAAALDALFAAVASGDPSVLGESPQRLLEIARGRHEQRGEFEAAAALIDVETKMVHDDPEFLVVLYRELARLRRQELLDDESALASYRKILEWVPEDADAEEAIEQIEGAAANWKQIVERFVQEAETATEPPLKASLYTSAAALVWQHKKKNKNKEVDELFEKALESDPGDGRASRLYALTLRSRKKGAELASVLLRAAGHARMRDDKVSLYVQAGRAWVREKQVERAAECFQHVLEFVPGHEEALRYLVEFYTEREEWDHLAALYEDALKTQKKLENEQGTLLQIGMVHWKMRGKPADAEPYFARLRKLDPAHPGMLQFYRELLGESDASGKLLAILGDAQRAAGQTQKIALALEAARTARDTGSVERAIDSWKAVQRIDPPNAEARSALIDLYRRGEKWNALVELLKQDADAKDESDTDGKVAVLRDLVSVYRDELRLDVMVINTYNAILQIRPDDADALDRLAATYESMGRWNDLIQVLTKQAEIAEGDAKVALYLRIAQLWIERFANYNKATEPLEALLAVDPTNREAIEQLKDIYTRKRAWKQLFDVQRRETDLEPDDARRLAMKIELAKLASEKLHRNSDAISLWREIVAVDASAEGALDALEKLSEREKDWPALSEALEKRIALTGAEAERVKLLTKLGTVYGEHQKDAAKAATAWQRVLELEPKNGRALRTLRESFVAAGDWDALVRLYAEANDWEGLVEVLGGAADRAENPKLKVELSFRAADVYVDRIGEPFRAFRNYERVLSAEPRNERAARALLPIYEREEKWPRLVGLLEVLVDVLPPESPERLEYAARARDVSLTRLADPVAGYLWAERAYGLAPENTAVIEGLERAADAARAHADLVKAFAARLPNAGQAEALMLRRRIAAIAGERLGRPDEAITQLRGILATDPRDHDATNVLERIYQKQKRFEDLEALLTHRLEHAEDDAERLSVLVSLGELEENVLARPDAASERYRAILAIDPSDTRALSALDRLSASAGRWTELANILSRRHDSVDSGNERLAILVRLGDVYRIHLARPDLALGCYENALDIDRTAVGAIEGLEALVATQPDYAIAAGRLLESPYMRRGDFEKLSRVLEQRLSVARDEDEKRELRLRLADLSSSELGNPSAAYTSLEAAFLDHSSDGELWDRLSGAAEASGRHEDLAKAYALALEGRTNDKDVVFELSRRVAALYDNVLGRPAEAERYHRRVLEIDGLDERAFLALKELYTNDERWDDLQALYRQRIGETVDAEQKLELLLQVCFLFEEILDDPERAALSYEAVLDLEPTHVAARRALERLYRRVGRHRDLLGLLRRDLDEAEGPQVLDLTYEIGTLHEQRLGEPKEAVDAYELVLQKSPSQTRAQEALERLLSVPSERRRVAHILEPVYESQTSWPNLARVLEIELEFEDNVGARVAILARLAHIQEERLRDLPGAMATFARAVEAEPSDAHVREELARLATATGRHTERAAVLERAAAASDTGYLRAEILGEVAELHSTVTRDLTAAASAYSRLIAVDPENADTVLSASRALERIHIAQGDSRALVDDLRRQVRFEDTDDARKALLIRVADLFELTLNDAASAIATHRERLELDPSDLSALSALERLHTAGEEWEPLIGVLEQREALIDNALEQRDLLFRIAQIRETKLDDRDGAIAAYDDLSARFGRDPEALVALSRLYGKTARFQELYDTLEARIEIETAPSRRADLRFEASEILRVRLESVERAIEGYVEVLESEPGHSGAVDALEDVLTGSDARTRVLAARALLPHYESTGRHADLVSALEISAGSDDPAEKLANLRRASEVADVGLSQPSQAFELLGRAVRSGLGEVELPEMLEGLERLARASNRQPDHVALLVSIADDVVDGSLQTEVLTKIARLARTELGDAKLASTYYTKVLEAEPENGPALDALDALHAEAGDHSAHLEVIRRKSELAPTPAARVTELMRFAAISEGKLGDVPSAIEALEQVASESPAEAAFTGLERLYTKAERWSDLAAIYERMIDSGIGSTSDVRHKLARVHLDRSNDPESALAQLRTITEADPAHAPTLAALEEMLGEGAHRGEAASILEPVYQKRMAWPKLITALEARLGVEEDTQERKAILTRVGQIHEDHLEDLAGAMESYARLFREDPTDQSVWELLSRLARAQGRWQRLADIYAETLETIDVDEPVTAELASITAKLYDERVQDPARAAPFYARALKFDPTDKESFDALESVRRRTKSWGDLLSLYRERLDLADSDAERVSILHRIAIVEETEQANAEAAIEAHRHALEIDPQDATSIEALDRLYLGRQRHTELAEHLRFRIDQARDSIEQNELRHRLGTLLAGPLEDPHGALDVFDEVVQVDPTHRATVASLEQLVMGEQDRLRITRMLEPIYRRTDEWMKLVVILEAQVELTSEVPEKTRLLAEIGQLHERRAGDAGLAFHAWSRAFALDPHDETAEREVERIASSAGAWNELVAAYDTALPAASDDPALVARILNTVARLHDEKRGDPRAAIETYERLLAHDPNDASPLDALEALHTLVGDWSGLVEVLSRKVELTYDATERADLLRRMGSVLEELLGDSQKAIEAYARAADEDSQDPIALEALDRLYDASNEHAKLADVLERRANVETDSALRVEVLGRLAQLAETQLSAPDRAIDSLVQLLEVEPNHVEATDSLVRLYERQARWSDLLDTLRRKAELVTGAEKVALVHRAGEVLERRLDDVSEATGAYEQALALDSRHEPSIQALLRIAQSEDHRERATEVLEPLLRAASRWDDVANTLSLRAEGAGDPLAKRDHLRALAEVHEKGRGDKAKAFATIRLALAEDPADQSVADEIERLGGELDAFSDVADTFAGRASAAADPEAARSLYVRLARVAEGKLGDEPRAIEAYSRALEQTGDDPDILLSLDRLHEKTASWGALGSILERRVDAASAQEDRAPLLVRLGRLRLERFGDERGAFAALQEVLEATPAHADARASLEGLVEHPTLGLEVADTLENAYKATSTLDKLPGLYEVRIARADSAGERVRLLEELAALEENELRRIDRALDARRRAFELDSRDSHVLSELERLASASGSFESLRGLVERVTANGDLDRETRRDLHLRAAGWYADRLGDVEAAEARLRSALEADAETPEAHERLIGLLRSSGRTPDLIAALRAYADADSDERGKKERLHEAAKLSESSGDLEGAGDALRVILDVDGGDLEALEALARVRRAQGRSQEVADLLVRRIDVELTPEVRLGLRRDLAALYAGPLEDPKRATEAYRGILDEEPTDLAAMDALEAIYERGKKWDDLRELLERRLDLANTTRDQVTARVRLARLAEQAFGRRAEAMDQLREILDLDPTNEEASEALERLLAAEGQWDTLVERLEARASASSGDRAVALLAHIAQIHGEQRGDAALSVAAHERVLALAPQNELSLRALVAAKKSAGDAAGTADALDRILPVLSKDEAIATGHELAVLAEQKLADVPRAEAALRRALALDPSHVESRAKLRDLLERHGRFTELAEVLADEAQSLTEPAKQVAAYKALADLHLTKRDDAATAASFLERASKLVPDDRDILLPLCDLYVRAGRGGDAVPVLRQIIASFGTKRTKEVATYHHRLGQALEAMGDKAGALEQLDAAFKLDLTSVPVLRDLGKLTHGMGDYDRSQKSFRALLLQKFGPDAGISKGDVYFFLGDIASQQGDKPKAISMLERAIAEDKGHARSSELLAKLKG